jgi:hypothetical protein
MRGASAADLVLSSIETQCTQTNTVGVNAISVEVQCESQVFVADKDTSIIYACGAYVVAPYNIVRQTGHIFHGSGPGFPGINGPSCARDIVPPTPHKAIAISWPAFSLDVKGHRGGTIIPNGAQASFNLSQSLQLEYCLAISALPPGVTFPHSICKTIPFPL